MAPHMDEIRWICDRLLTGRMPGTIGTRMPGRRRSGRGTEEVVVVVEQLRDDDVGARVDFAA